MGVYSEFRGFALAHRGCELRGDAEPLSAEGYRLWARCSCGARFERWATEDDAEADLLRSTLASVRELYDAADDLARQPSWCA